MRIWTPLGVQIIFINTDYINIVLTEKNVQLLSFYLQNDGSVMSKIVRFFHPDVFQAFLDFKKKGGTYIEKENINNEVSLFIPESLISDKELSNYSIAVYCVLHELCVPTQFFHQCITQQQIEFYLTGQISGRRRISDYIRCGLNELIDSNIVIKEKEIQKHYILDCSKLWIDTKNMKFTIITFSEVRKIFQIENVNNFLQLRYFILLMGTISSRITVFLHNGENKNRVVGNVSIEYL